MAARGIDIPNVDLVVQMEAPRDLESYIHRAGRTARAGKTGKAIMFLPTDSRDHSKRDVERKAGIKFK